MFQILRFTKDQKTEDIEKSLKEYGKYDMQWNTCIACVISIYAMCSAAW